MKRFVQFLGLLWFSFGLVGALGYIVGFGSGLNVLTLSDVLGVLGWTTMMVLGLGLLTLREWGRLGSLAV
ncbi:MAG: hypothetical protein GY722_17770, partial [bacterium]|nr:hypothetical protein [bacterium]